MHGQDCRLINDIRPAQDRKGFSQTTQRLLTEDYSFRHLLERHFLGIPTSDRHAVGVYSREMWRNASVRNATMHTSALSYH